MRRYFRQVRDRKGVQLRIGRIQIDGDTASRVEGEVLQAKTVHGITIRAATQFNFWSRVAESDGCWEWKGRINKDGYGEFKVNPYQFIASRLSWMLVFGEIPDGMMVCHHCDNRECVSPAHLFLGTALDNEHDKIAKGRARYVTGPENPQSKLNPDAARAIRDKLAAGHRKSTIAAEHGVSESLIRKINLNLIWRTA